MKHEIAPITYITPEAIFTLWINPGALRLSSQIVVEGQLAPQEVIARDLPTSMADTKFTIQRRVFHPLGSREALTRAMDEVLNEVAEWMDVEPVIAIG